EQGQRIGQCTTAASCHGPAPSALPRASGRCTENYENTLSVSANVRKFRNGTHIAVRDRGLGSAIAAGAGSLGGDLMPAQGGAELVVVEPEQPGCGTLGVAGLLERGGDERRLLIPDPRFQVHRQIAHLHDLKRWYPSRSLTLDWTSRIDLDAR